MRRAIAAAFTLCTGALFTGCPAPGPCDQLADGDLSAKYGDCTQVSVPPLLGSDRATCTTKLSRCSAGERDVAQAALECLQAVAKCSAATQAAWVAQRDVCYAPLKMVSASCVESLAVDYSAFDAGQPDAGPQPVEDGGAGVDLIVVADENTFAAAWTPLQTPSNVTEWHLIMQSDAGVAPLSVRPNTAIDFLIVDAGGGTDLRRFFIVGLGPDGIAQGFVRDAGVFDAGFTNCQQNRDCSIDQVCSLNVCRKEVCSPGGPRTCPTAYNCSQTAYCLRDNADAGSFDAGFLRVDAGPADRLLPMASAVVTASLGPVMTTTQSIGSYAASRPDLVAIDSARVVVAMIQEGNVVAHTSHRRGRDFQSNEAQTTSIIDTRGADVHLAYNADSRLLFACYTVGTGVRVRASADLGLTWLSGAADIESSLDPDGGIGELVRDCDIAAWQSGGALLVTVEGNRLVTRAVSPTLTQTLAGIAFTGNDESDAGVAEVGSPSHPAIATLPADGVVHLTFTGNRVVNPTGLRDPEVYGLFRNSTRAYGQPLLLGPANAFLQDYTTVIIDPVTKRPLAAFTSTTERSGIQYTTVYVSQFNVAQSRWSTGDELNLQYKPPMMNTHSLMPFKRAEDSWDAFSPSLTVSPAGKITLGFIAGQRAISGLGNDYRAYAIGYDFTAANPVISTPGYLLPPAVKVSDTRARDPRSGSGPVAPVGVIMADRQISVFGAFQEGVGPMGDQDSKAMLITRP